MSKSKLLFIMLCMINESAQAFDFENTTCSVVKTKSDSSPSAIKLGKVSSMTKTEAAKFGQWHQITNSMDFIDVEVFIDNGNVNRSFYRVVDGTLHQSFPSADGQYIFRRIIPSVDPRVGRYDQVKIKGSSLESTLLNALSCEKSLF